VNAKDRSGNLPLHAAAKAGKMELVKHLIGLGANVGHRNSYRQTAYDVATSHVVRQYLLPLQLRVRA
jgi:ankyrin repeat protein